MYTPFTQKQTANVSIDKVYTARTALFKETERDTGLENSTRKQQNAYSHGYNVTDIQTFKL